MISRIEAKVGCMIGHPAWWWVSSWHLLHTGVEISAGVSGSSEYQPYYSCHRATVSLLPIEVFSSPSDFRRVSSALLRT